LLVVLTPRATYKTQTINISNIFKNKNGAIPPIDAAKVSSLGKQDRG